MSVWLRRLSIIFSIITIFIIAGCDASMEKPLTKDETSEVQSAQKVNEREISIAADVEPPELDVFKKEEEDTESDNAKESESGSEDKDTDINEEENGETPDPESSIDDPGTDGESAASITTANQTTSSNEQEKNTNESSGSNNTNSNATSNQSGQKNSKTKEESSEKTEAPKDTLVYSIVISDSEVPLSPTEVEVKDGDSVLDVLIRITQAKGIQMDYRGGQGGSAYVEGIDNVYEFDRGQGSGWMYRVNGIFPDRGAGVVPLLPGDRVEWLYTTDLGQDLGADLKPFRR